MNLTAQIFPTAVGVARRLAVGVQNRLVVRREAIYHHWLPNLAFLIVALIIFRVPLLSSNPVICGDQVENVIVSVLRKVARSWG